MAAQKTIDLQEFRTEYQIPAASARAILSKLGYVIEKVNDKHQIICGSANTFGKADEYFLKHAVLEFRRTMDVASTLQGKFFEFSEEAEVKGKKVITEYGVSKIDAEQISPKTPSLKRAPNAASVGITGQGAAIVPTSVETTALAAAPDALAALVAALTQVQAPPAPPRDPLLPQKQLKEAEQQGYRITTQQLADLLGMSAQTIGSKKSGFIKLGFCFEKVKEGASTLWKVKQVD